MLFFAGDGPPGFEIMKRRRGREWIGQNDALLRLPDTALDRLYAAILTNIISEGAREVAMAKTRRQANQIIDAVIEYCLPADAGRRVEARGRASRRPTRPRLTSRPRPRPGRTRAASRRSGAQAAG